MRIFFFGKEVNFVEESREEGVGWEADFNSSAGPIKDRPNTWLTSWGNFLYEKLPQTSSKNMATYSYEGPLAGFLQQDLLPDFGSVEVISCKGTYGAFTGKDSLSSYRAEKARYEKKTKSLAKELGFVTEVNGYESYPVYLSQAAAALAGRLQNPEEASGWNFRGYPQKDAATILWKILPGIDFATRLRVAKWLHLWCGY